MSNARERCCAAALDEVKNSGDCTMPRIRHVGQEAAAVLIVLCGPSHAGKTTFARRFGENFTIISSDEIRKRLSGRFGNGNRESKVWDVFDFLKRKALKEGRSVILDACHISEKARRHSLEGPNGRHRKICIVFDLPLDVLQQRALKTKRVCLNKVERMWIAFQQNKPNVGELKREGFDVVCFVRR